MFDLYNMLKFVCQGSVELFLSPVKPCIGGLQVAVS
jgi:hypothetical protein